MNELGLTRENRIGNWLTKLFEVNKIDVPEDQLKKMKGELLLFVREEIITAKSANLVWLISVISSYERNITNVGVDQIIHLLRETLSNLNLVSAESKNTDL